MNLKTIERLRTGMSSGTRLDDLRCGFFGPTAEGVPDRARVGLVLARVVLWGYPPLLLLSGFTAVAAGQSLASEAEALSNDPWLVILSLGFILLASLAMMLVAGIIVLIGYVAMVVSIPLALGLAMGIGEFDRREGRGLVLGMLSLAIPCSLPLAVVAGGLFAPFGLVVVGLPIAALACLGGREARAWSRPDRAAPRAPLLTT